MSVCSGNGMHSLSCVASGKSNRHNSTLVACAENTAKLTPTPVQVAPSGYGSPGQTRIDRTRFKPRATGDGGRGDRGSGTKGLRKTSQRPRGLRDSGLESAHVDTPGDGVRVDGGAAGGGRDHCR